VSLVSTKQAGLAGFTKYRSLADASGNPTMLAPGMVLVTDYTITHAGTSATLTNGQVTFTGVTSLSLDGVFSADFDTYVVAVRGVCNSSNVDINMRLRASGTDNSTASSYTRQRIVASNTSVTADRVSEDVTIVSTIGSEQRSGFWLNVYGPFLTQPTAGRSVMIDGTSGARILDYAFTHNQSASYDGVTLSARNVTRNITGALQVYGVRS